MLLAILSLFNVWIFIRRMIFRDVELCRLGKPCAGFLFNYYADKSLYATDRNSQWCSVNSKNKVSGTAKYELSVDKLHGEAE